MSRRALKIAAWVLGGLVTALVLCLVAVRLLFDPNEHKDEMQAAFREATGRDLKLEGPLTLSVFPWLAVTTDDAAISNRPGFSDEPFARLGHARLGLRVWPLLASQRLEVGPVQVGQLDLNLAVAEDGSNNWSDLLDRLQRKPAAAPAGRGTRSDKPASLEVSIASLELHEASVSFRDEQTGAHYVVSDIELETGALRPGHPVDLRARLALSRDGTDLGSLDVGTQMKATRDGVLELAETSGEISLLGADGSETPIRIRAPRVDLSTASRAIAAPLVEVSVGSAALQASLHFRQGRQGPELQGSFTLPPTSPRELLQALGSRPPATRDRKALGHLEARGRIAYSDRKGLQLDPVAITLDDTKVNGRLGLNLQARRTVRFELQADALDVDRYLAPARAGPASRPPTVAAERDVAPFDALRRLDLDGTASLGKLRISGIDLQQVHAGLRAHEGRIVVDPLRAGAFGGRTSSSLTVDVTRETPALHLEQQLENVDVAGMLGQLINLRQLEGRGRAKFVLDTQGGNFDELFRGLHGTFDITVADGALLGADLRYEIERALGAARLERPAAENTGRTEFETLHGRGTLAERTLRNQQLEFVSDVATVRGRGDVDYGRNLVDLDLTARLLRLPPGRMFGIKLSRVENIAIPVDVTGPIDAPKVRPDVNSLLQAVARSSAQQSMEDQVKQKLDGLLGF